MRKLALLAAAVGLGLLSLSASAFGAAATGSDCDYAQQQGGTAVVDSNGATAGGDQVYVYNGTPGSTNTASSSTGTCVNVDSTGGQGGFVETGQNADGSQRYAVADGDNNNANPGDGYVGVSNYESGAKQTPPCKSSSTQTGTGSNSGGCGGIKGVADPIVPPVDVSGIPTPICGNTSGPTWNNTVRDGCFIP